MGLGGPAPPLTQAGRRGKPLPGRRSPAARVPHAGPSPVPGALSPGMALASKAEMKEYQGKKEKKWILEETMAGS